MEVGSGRGALTRPLARIAGRLVAIEIDAILADKLSGELDGSVEIINADFLSVALPSGPYKVIGNIPFSITTDIIRKLIDAPEPPVDAWLIVQREAAHRLCGSPYSSETLWSLRLKPCWHV